MLARSFSSPVQKFTSWSDKQRMKKAWKAWALSCAVSSFVHANCLEDPLSKILGASSFYRSPEEARQLTDEFRNTVTNVVFSRSEMESFFLSPASEGITPRDLKIPNLEKFGLLNSVQKTLAEDWRYSLRELALFWKAALKSKAERPEAFNRWVKSPEHAEYFMEQVPSMAQDEAASLIAYLRSHNPEFKDTVYSPGSKTHLISHSLEKESNSSAFALYYRPRQIPENVWFAASDEMRAEAMKRGISGWVPTQLKPKHLGEATMDGNMPEVKTRGYTLSLNRHLKHVAEVAKDTQEMHSFHSNTVFDLPLDEMSPAEKTHFWMWFEDINFGAMMRGLEEGLHPGPLTGPYVASARQFSRPVFDDHKLHSIGFRVGKYGETSPGKLRACLEARDTTRDLAKLEKQERQLTKSVADAVWKRVSSDRSLLSNFWGSVTENRFQLDLIRAGVPKKWALEFFDYLDNYLVDEKRMSLTALPLVEFEKMRFNDYRNGQTFGVTAEQRKRLESARAHYLEELRKLSDEIGEIRKREETEKTPPNERLAPIEVEAAMKYILTDWAKKARISELYAHY
jgi:hypothetical protein